MTTEFDRAVQAQSEAADSIETAAIQLAVLEEQLSAAKDALALVEAQVRISAPLLGKNAEDREAELLVRLRRSEEWQAASDEVVKTKALVETQRAALERVRMKRQEWLQVMRFLTNLGIGPLNEL